MLSNLVNEYCIPSITVCKGALSINHLLFDDNSVVFCKVDVDTTRKLQKLLLEYEIASGQHINSDKIVMMFSNNTPPDTRKELMAMSTNDTLQKFKKYQGLPLMIGSTKRKAFSNIKD